MRLNRRGPKRSQGRGEGSGNKCAFVAGQAKGHARRPRRRRTEYDPPVAAAHNRSEADVDPRELRDDLPGQLLSVIINIVIRTHKNG